MKKNKKFNFDIITLSILAPLGALIYILINTTLTDISTLQKEIYGLKYNRAIFQLMLDTQVYHGLQLNNKDLYYAKEDIFKDIEILRDIKIKFNKTIDINDKLNDTFLHLQNNLIDDINTPPYTQFNNLTASVEKIYDLMVDVADKSNLTLEPNISRYYLANLLSSTIPSSIEHIGHARGSTYHFKNLLNHNMDYDKSSETKNTEELLSKKIGMKLANKSLNISVKKAIKHNRKLSSRIKHHLDLIKENHKEINKLTNDIIHKDNDTNPVLYFTKVTQLISLYSNLYDFINLELSKVLNKKIINEQIKLLFIILFSMLSTILTITTLINTRKIRQEKEIAFNNLNQHKKHLKTYNDLLKKNKKEALDAKQEADKARRLKNDFLATMSHEIRTPMNGIIGMTELILETKLEPKQRKHALTIMHSTENLLTIINNILDFAKITSEKIELESISFNMFELFESIMDLMSITAEEKHLNMTLNYNIDHEYLFIGDPIKLRQIVINLINNAIKFTKKGSITITISECEKENSSPNQKTLKIEIEDTGIGIAKESQKRIFEEFFQADTSTTKNHKGTGLGLAICKKLVHMMNGEIGVENKSGKGSSFWFTIKLDKDNYPNTSTKNNSNTLSFDGYKALVAEDNRINAAMIEEVLLGMKFTKVRIAENGKTALREVIKDDYDIILMDCQMPEMDGFTAAMRMRHMIQNKDLKNIPIIAITANAMKGDKEKCLSSGMNDYIAKPIKKKALFDIIAKWLTPKDIDIPSNDHDNHQVEILNEDTFEIYKSVMGDHTKKNLDNFLQETSSLIKKVEYCYISNVASDFIDILHTLKSTSEIIGASALQRKSEILKEECQSLLAKGMDLSYLPKHKITELEIDFKALKKHIGHIINTMD